MIKSPNSAVADAYRVLRTNLIFTSAETTGRVILVTSANPGEGKTTTLANLAAALAQNGAKVLAVDADLRRPTLNQHFGLPEDAGALRPDRREGGGVAGDPDRRASTACSCCPAATSRRTRRSCSARR